MTAREKIKQAEDLVSICRKLRREGARIVFTNGCFDLLHVGHVRYLEAARELGGLLVVGVNSDASVRQIKGPSRPIIGEQQRGELVGALHCVDYVVLFDAPDPLDLILMIEPDVLVKGADWPLEKIVGADSVLGRGGEVVRIPMVPMASTTGILEIIAARFARQAQSGCMKSP